jgi:hypothetical protein
LVEQRTGVPQKWTGRGVRFGTGAGRRRRQKVIVALDGSWEISRGAVRLGLRGEVKWEAGGAGRSGAGTELGGRE